MMPQAEPVSEPSNFDFSKYKVSESTPQNQNSEAVVSENQPIGESQPFDFSSYRVKEPPTKTEELIRHGTRTASRLIENSLGFPGDVVSFVKGLSEKLPDAPDFLQKEPNFIQKAGKSAIDLIPSSEDLKKASSSLTSGYTDPQGDYEKLGDEVSSLASVLVNPLKAITNFPQFLKTLGKAYGKATTVKASGKGAELLGADETTKNYVEMGTLFLTGLLGKKTAGKFVGEKYKEAASKIPQGTVLNTQNLFQSLEAVDQQLAQGVSTNTKKEVRAALKELKDKASGGHMLAEEIVESVHNINERINSKGLFDELSTSERKQLKYRYDKVKDVIHDEIEQYGKSNPEFYKSWTDANNAHGTIAQSKGVSNFLQSKLGKIPHHLAGSIALDLFLGNPMATIGVAGSYGAVKLGEFLYRVAKSKPLQEHYMKVILEAGNENLPGVVKHLNALDKEAKLIEKADQSSKSQKP